MYYIEMPLSDLQKERIEGIAREANKEVFRLPFLKEAVKKALLKNTLLQNEEMILGPNWGDTYYDALFSAILTIENPSVIKIETILKAIQLKDKECFFFFVKDILAEKNPVCIEDSPTKQLIVAIIKKRA